MTLDRGWLEDEVQIVLTEQSLSRRCKSYSVKTSVFQQPAAFSLRCGEPATAAEIVKRHQPGDPFELRLLRAGDSPGTYDLNVPLQTGRLDAVDIPESEETVVEFRGRDNMAALFDSYFMQDDSVTEATYYDLVAKQLLAVGFEPDTDWLFTGDTGRKKAVTNAGGGMRRAKVEEEPQYVVELLELNLNLNRVQGFVPMESSVESRRLATHKWIMNDSTGKGAVSAPKAPPDVDAKNVEVETVTGGQPKRQLNVIKAEVGQQRYAWLKDKFQKVGLFLWCMPNGQFILSAPNADQEPAFRLQRKFRAAPGENNILSGGLRNDTVQRYSHTLVYGRKGGGKEKRERIVGEYVDEEMAARFVKQISYNEPDIKTQQAADNLARRYAADARREARSLTYTVAGHSAPSLIEPGKRFPFWVNLVAHVYDERLGIDGKFYVGEVEFRRDMSGTTTTLTLYWPEDLVFGEEA